MPTEFGVPSINPDIRLKIVQSVGSTVLLRNRTTVMELPYCWGSLQWCSCCCMLLTTRQSYKKSHKYSALSSNFWYWQSVNIVHFREKSDTRHKCIFSFLSVSWRSAVFSQRMLAWIHTHSYTYKRHVFQAVLNYCLFLMVPWISCKTSRFDLYHFSSEGAI
jgi:hypothetical protein